MRVAALIPAAGEGRRLGQGPKALLMLGSKPLVVHTLRAFEAEVDEIVVAVSRKMQASLPALDKEIATPVRVILGAASRQETVLNLLEATAAESVLIHDAARPFLPRRILKDVLQELEQQPAVSVTRPLADSLIHAETGEALDRAQLRAVQTPQAFQRDLILRAHHKARASGQKATDDATLVRALGHEVAQVEGSSWLFKITTPADYVQAQALQAVWNRDET